ncbi:tRNA (adenosine(37)-N6)-threonylcarbamoyltransferase complex transferase subunit TsaD [Erysipelotrichaceae bacterium RD49]|nr:tRNA (adenosine(37)-N6)-threonylcarbamoyltransferase complex transferase subunit TsaD [Erysipelotrichaceae bacterium RD49]
MIVFAIESSCDETAASVVKDQKEVLSNVVSSQIDTHVQFGGVVPEVASRLHVENISVVIDQAIKESGLTWDDIDLISVTQGPGLIGCLHVGVQAAKTLAMLFDKPLVGVNHLAGHIYANKLDTTLQFPLLGLLVSGGNSELIYMKDENSFEILGETQDDAIGEAYDKVARVLNLGYPGGPKIDKLAKLGKPIYKLPRPKAPGEYDFSFSGLKSGVLQFVKRMERNNEEWKMEDLAASFQETALEEIFTKVRKAIADHPEVKQMIVGGGVSANSRLREKVQELAKQHPEIDFNVPPMSCCTDNAAMIAIAGEIAYQNGRRADESLSADAGLELQ